MTSVFLGRARLPSQRVGAKRAARGGACYEDRGSVGLKGTETVPPGPPATRPWLERLFDVQGAGCASWWWKDPWRPRTAPLGRGKEGRGLVGKPLPHIPELLRGFSSDTTRFAALFMAHALYV